MAVSMEVFGRNNKIQKVIGAIDGTYVSMSAPASQRLVYTNRKFFTSMTLQAICNEKLLFLDCFAGYPSSVHDSRVFRNSDIYLDIERDVDSFFPNGEKILGDMAYPLKKWLMVPYVDRGHLSDQQKHYNHKLSAARQVVERSFALLFGRFRRLKHIYMHRIDAIPKFIIACCVLHNICLRFEDPFVRIYSREGQYFLRSVEGVDGELPRGLQVNVDVPNGNPPNGEPINEELNAMPPEEEENPDNSAERERENIAMLLYLNR
jgi:DDE superfamily endonuclease